MAILTKTVTDSNDFRALLLELDYEQTLDMAKAAYIQYRTQNIPMPWDMLYRAYMQSALQIRGLDFSGFTMPEAPEVPGDDFEAWVEQMEGDYADAYGQQYSGIAMF